MSDRRPTPRGARLCADWLRKCKEFGWPPSATAKLCDLWWEYHDDDGNLTQVRQVSATGDSHGS